MQAWRSGWRLLDLMALKLSLLHWFLLSVQRGKCASQPALRVQAPLSPQPTITTLYLLPHIDSPPFPTQTTPPLSHPPNPLQATSSCLSATACA